MARRFEITVLGGADDKTPMMLLDRCTLMASDTADAARKYAALFVTGQSSRPSAEADSICCRDCGATIQEEDTGVWETGGLSADARRHCSESRDHRHHPLDEPCGDPTCTDPVCRAADQDASPDSPRSIPDEAHAAIVRAAWRWDEASDGDDPAAQLSAAGEALEAFARLDAWLCKGGSKPEAWR